MNNSEILEQIKQLGLLINKALHEANEGQNISFFKTVIQQNAIEIYQKASLLETGSHAKAPEIRIITQEQVTLKEEPPMAPAVEKTPEPPVREREQPTPEPVIEKHDIPAQKIPEALPEKPAPAIQAPVNNPAPEITHSKPVEPAPIQPVKPAAKILREQDEQELSLNDKLSKNKQPVMNVADKSKETPIPDLVKAISIAKKFEFINGLFDGNSEVYRSALQSVQNSSSYEEASEFLGNNIVNTYSWDENEELAAEFFALVKRRFIS